MPRLPLLMILACCACLPLMAADSAPATETVTKPALFINLTTAEPHRANMAVSFALNQLKRGHRVTIFANDQGVKVLPAAGDATLSESRTALAAVIAAGGTVLACPMCTKHFALDPAGYLPGVTLSNPELTEKALFAADTRTLSW
jgi:hypothetical protein